MGLPHLFQRDAVEKSIRQGQEYGDLFDHSDGRKFRLLETGPNALTVGQDLSRIIVEPRAEAGKGFEFLELRVGHADEETRAQALSDGAVAFLIKPLNEEMVLTALKTALSGT